MDERPFDARATWLCEQDEAPHEWRTVSLVTAVRALVAFEGQTPDEAGRLGLLRSCLDTLTARGVDGDSLLRFGFLPELISPLIFRRVISPALSDKERVDLDLTLAQRGVDVAGWESLLGPAHPGVEGETGGVCNCCAKAVGDSYILTGAMHQMAPVFAWVFEASVDELLSLRPPSKDALELGMARRPPERSLFTTYRWLVDRFSTTNLRDWEDQSLHFEHQYQGAAVPPPVPEPLMSDRAVAADELNAEIARRVVAPKQEAREQYGSVLARQMQGKAEEFLGEGRRPEAAALFDFALSQQPDDPDALNNLAFCLLPDDPETALRHLRRSRSLGYVPLSINVYNEALALVAQGHARHALQVVEDHWGAICASPPTGGTLWQIDHTGAFALVHTADLRTALLTLCLDLARAQGGPAAERWGARAVS